MSQCSVLQRPEALPDADWGSQDLTPRTLRNLLGTYPTGVAIVTTRADDGRPVGLTINSFAPVSLEPPLVLWSLVNHSSNYEVFRDCPYFAIHFLDVSDAALASHFANSSVADKFAGVAYQQSPEGVPALDAALTTLICAHDHCKQVGDHLLMFGRIVRTAHRTGSPLVFHHGRFASLPSPT